jgi:hypothetical protein|tara:strand:+ start:457 stop:807 length:351 start_codon:yes stop_codon:yes gene_type:complete
MVHVCMLWSTKAENMKVAAVGNLALSLCIGFHYFLRVWSPAMEGHPPKTSQLSYTLYTGERVYFYFKFIFIYAWAICVTMFFLVYSHVRGYGVQSLREAGQRGAGDGGAGQRGDGG